MNLSTVKKSIMEMLGNHYHFVYRGSRNQVEEFDGIILKCFPSIFLIQLDDGTCKSFSYNDFIIKNIKIQS